MSALPISPVTKRKSRKVRVSNVWIKFRFSKERCCYIRSCINRARSTAFSSRYEFDGNNGLWYELQGDYYLPCLKLPEEEQAYIGIWGQRHLRYLKKHHRVLYGNLLTSGKLNSYLVDIDRQAEEMFERLVKQMAEREGVTEQLKAANSMEWVRKLNSIRNRAVEITNSELIYA